jgi:hypothetical protein
MHLKWEHIPVHFIMITIFKVVIIKLAGVQAHLVFKSIVKIFIKSYIGSIIEF